MSQNDRSSLPFIYHFISGSIAGVSEILIMYPLDVVKTRLQLKQIINSSAELKNKDSFREYVSLVDYITKIVKKEGIRRIYNGIASPIMMEAPKRATKFACNDKYQDILKNYFNNNELTQSVSIVSGTMAGMTEALIIVPFELVKVKMQDINSKYHSTWICLKNIISNNGIRSLYTGLEPTIWRNSIWNASYFGIIFHIRSLLPNATTPGQQTRNDLVAGSLGGSLSCFLSVPFDVVKSRLQSAKVSLLNYRTSSFSNTLPLIWHIYKKEGIKSLYRGITPIICRYGPSGGLMLIVFTSVNNLIKSFHLSDAI